MSRLETCCPPGIAFAAVLIAAALRLYSRRPRERIPCHEELDDAKVAEAFNRVALMPQMGLLRRYVAQRATEMTARGEAVDLGCGPGYLAVEMARRAPELHVTGVDLSDEMLTEAEDYAGRHDMAQAVSFRKGNVQRIPFADGSVDLSFGQKVERSTGTTTTHNGWDIRAKAGSSVQAVSSGRVAYANWLHGYGQVVIIDHGDSYHSIMAHLATITAKVGDEVTQGARIGSVGDTGSLRGTVLYFELRHRGMPIDPKSWLRR